MLLVVAGIVLGIVGFVVAIVRADQASGSIGRLGVPGTTSGQLEAGTYRVEDAYNYGYYSSSYYEAPDIEVYDPAGEEIPVTVAPSFSSSAAIAAFTVPIDGRYDVAATVPRGADEWDVISTVQIERDSGELSAAYLPWFLLGLLGGTGLAGVRLIMVIVAAVQRSRARPKPVPAMAAPGWGPPPMWVRRCRRRAGAARRRRASGLGSAGTAATGLGNASPPPQPGWGMPGATGAAATGLGERPGATGAAAGPSAAPGVAAAPTRRTGWQLAAAGRATVRGPPLAAVPAGLSVAQDRKASRSRAPGAALRSPEATARSTSGRSACTAGADRKSPTRSSRSSLHSHATA
ncbi:MAG: hypothetical protein R2699_04895 [Acidimicrobiales bacterium]